VLPVGAVAEVSVVEVVLVNGGVPVVDDVPLVDVVPDAGLVVTVSVGTGTMVAEVSAGAVVVVDSDVVLLVSLVVVSVLLHATSNTASAAALIHFIKIDLLHSHELPFIRATIFATSM